MKIKKINISGIQNTKKYENDNTREVIKSYSIPDSIYEHQTQRNSLNSLYMTDSCFHKDIIMKELQNKLRGYVQQDKQNTAYNVATRMKEYELIELLVGSKLLCNYCRCKVYILYKEIRQSDQWTLDRIDNAKDHSIGNCVIACYACNVQKKRMDDDKFRFTKQMKIIKKG